MIASTARAAIAAILLQGSALAYDLEWPASEYSGEKPAPAAEAEKPAPAQEGEKAASAPEAEKPASAQEAEKAASAQDAEKPAPAHEAEKAASAHEAEKPASAHERKRAGSGHEAGKTASAREGEAPDPAHEAQKQAVGSIRAVTRQFDKLANRDGSEAVDLKQSRSEHGKKLHELAQLEGAKEELIKHAEIYVLSGGDVDVLQHLEEDVKPGLEETLYEGVLAYGRGRNPEAEAKLLPLDARSFDAMRGGHLALAQALLVTRMSVDRAYQYFDLARLLLPGTLVEEAALRQIAVLAAKKGDKDRLASSAAAYLRRFRHSAYIAGFETQLAYNIARLPAEQGSFILQDIQAALPRGWGRCQACFFTTIAEQALLLGKTGLAVEAALAGLPLAPDGTAEKQRMLLYQGAAQVVTDDFVRGTETLQSLKPESLPGKDRELLNASLALSAKLRATPIALTSPKLEALASGTPKGERRFIAGERVEQAKAALANADSMLSERK
jgi:chemotaxis protein MotC